MSASRPIRWTAFLLAAASFAGCGLVNKTTEMPVNAVRAVLPGSKAVPVDPSILQVEIQRYADEYSAMTFSAIEAYADHVNTDEARNQALRWKVQMLTSTVSIASGPSPIANLIDFIAVATITRSVIEDHWSKTPQGAAFQTWLDCGRKLETDAWKIANGVLSPELQKELRETIRGWLDANVTTRIGFFARPLDFAEVVRRTAQQAKSTGGLFSLLGLDPTAALDPAVREVTRTRLFAERAMFVVQRYPYIMRGQIDLLVYQLTHEPQVLKALAATERLSESSDRISRATESVSQTASMLPDRISAERKAILDAFEAQEGKLRGLSKDLEGTLTAGDKMSTSLNATLITFDALMKRFGVGEPETGGPPDPNSKPFNILDYATAAERMATMAKELDVLIKDAGSTLDSPALEKRFRDLGAVAERATADARSLINHACLLVGGLVILAFACALAYRWLSPRGAKARSAEAALAKSGA